MKKMTKFTALLMALVLSMGTMTACGGNGDSSNSSAPAASEAAGGDATAAGDASAAPAEKQKVTLKVWAPQEEQKGEYGGDYGTNLLDYMVKSFNESQSAWDLTIEASVCAEGEAKKEIQKDPKAAADVFMFAGDQGYELQDNGVLYPLEGDGIEAIKQNNPAEAIDAITFEDKDLGGSYLYGVPFTPNQWFMYYDKSKFSEEEVKSLDTMMSKDLGKDVYNFSMPIQDAWYAGSFFFAAGCTVYQNEAGEADEKACTFANEAGKTAAEYMIDLSSNKKFLCEDGKGTGISYFKEGKLGAWCGGSWDAANVKKALKDNYAAVALPTVKIGDAENNLMEFADYKYIGVNANSENVAAAQAFAEWLGGEQCQKDRYAARGVVPTWTSVAQDSKVQEDPIVAALNEQGKHLVPRVKVKAMNNYWTPIEAFAKGVYAKEITKDNVQEKLDQMVKNMTTSITE